MFKFPNGIESTWGRTAWLFLDSLGELDPPFGHQYAKLPSLSFGTRIISLPHFSHVAALAESLTHVEPEVSLSSRKS